MAEPLVPRCDKCGLLCFSGHEIRYYGEVDPETGYKDEEIVCNHCLDESEDDSDDERAAQADRVLTGMYEES